MGKIWFKQFWTSLDILEQNGFNDNLKLLFCSSQVLVLPFSGEKLFGQQLFCNLKRQYAKNCRFEFCFLIIFVHFSKIVPSLEQKKMLKKIE